MNDNTTEAAALDMAIRHGQLGHKICPVPHGTKAPKMRDWPNLATDDIGQITDWWGGDEQNLAWAMGLQPNGRFYITIDVDGDKGKASLAELMKAHADLKEMIVVTGTVCAYTGGDGYHYVVEVPPELEINNRRLADGIDIRGEGGCIIVAPSLHPNGNHYRWAPTRAPWETEPVQCPPSIIEMLTPSLHPVTLGPAPAAVSVSTLGGEPPSVDDESPADWVRRNVPIAALLEEGGWVLESTRGDDTLWTRPGKAAKDGHSAILHGDAPFVCWSTNAPPAFANVGRDNYDGSYTLSPSEVYAAVHFGGNMRLAMSHVRKSLMPRREPRRATHRVRDETEAPDETDPIGEGLALNLPPEFWESRETLRHIRDAAWNRGMSPDAVLGAVLARVAATIPVGYTIPAIVGARGTFDHLSVLVGHSSGGKSAAAAIAEELLPDVLTKTIVWDWPAPSGEGLIDAFFEMVDEVDSSGKKTRVKKQTKQAVHFTIEEAMALVSQTQRSGTTIASVVLSAWSGSTIGQGNASDDRKRVLKKGRARVSGLLGIQSKLGHKLLTPELISQGLAGRLVFFAAEDPSIPERGQKPPWPGPLAVTPMPIISGGVVVGYPPEVHEEVEDAHHAERTGRVVYDPIDGHSRLVRLKLAGLLAALEARHDTTITDWTDAGLLVDSSKRIRQQMKKYEFEAAQDAQRARGVAAAMVQDAQEATTQRVQISRCTEAIRKAVVAHGPIHKKALKQHISSSHRKADVLNVALSEMLEAKVIKETDEGFVSC